MWKTKIISLRCISDYQSRTKKSWFYQNNLTVFKISKTIKRTTAGKSTALKDTNGRETGMRLEEGGNPYPSLHIEVTHMCTILSDWRLCVFFLSLRGCPQGINMLGSRYKYITVVLLLVSVTASSVSENCLLLRWIFLVFGNVRCGCFIANYWKAQKLRISCDNWRLVHLLPF